MICARSARTSLTKFSSEKLNSMTVPQTYEIDPKIQVCAQDYRPEFKRLDLKKPSYDEIVEVHNVLKDTGLKTVICQADRGHIGP